jgi:hypothetical protein
MMAGQLYTGHVIMATLRSPSFDDERGIDPTDLDARVESI